MKNVAYVFSPVGYQIVYAIGVDSTVSGFERKVLMVNATDITSTDVPTATAQMILRGREELAKNQSIFGFDGELTNSSYQYYIDYDLGDLVEIQDEDGNVAKMKVTEQIFVSDKEGDRSYPTLTVSEIIAANTWFGWQYSKFWSEAGATEYWATS
jgi:hypothetical protein